MWTDCQSDTIQKRPSNMEIKNYSQGYLMAFNNEQNKPFYNVYIFIKPYKIVSYEIKK